ncbi:MAG TPA: hypothetical protein V6D18_15740 [Thermosynechococcaceae cyanobacterium]
MFLTQAPATQTTNISALKVNSFTPAPSRPKLSGHWTKVDGKLTCIWLSDPD